MVAAVAREGAKAAVKGGKEALSLFKKNLKKLADTGDEWATGQLRRIGTIGNKNVKTQGTAREIGRGSPGSVVVKDAAAPGGSRMARGEKTALKKKLQNELKALTKSGAIKAGGAAAITIPIVEGTRRLLSDDDDATTDQMKKDQQMLDEIAAQAAKDAKNKSGKTGSGKTKSGKGSGKSTGAKTESKTFRERRLARMKRRLKDAENEGRKRRLKRRIGRVEGRIEDTKERRAARGKAGGGEMVKASVPGYKDGDLVKKQGYNARLDESLGSRNGTKTQSMKDRRDESKGMEKSMGRRAYSGNKSSGQTKSRKPSRPQSAGVAKRGWGAAIR